MERSAPPASPSFTGVAGRPFHLNIPAGAMSAVCHLERSVDGVTWLEITFAGSELYAYALGGQSVSEDITEPQAGVAWRLDCGALNGTYNSGTIAGSFTQ